MLGARWHFVRCVCSMLRALCHASVLAMRMCWLFRWSETPEVSFESFYSGA